MLRFARKQFVQRRFRRNPGTTREDFRDEANFTFMRGRQHQFVREAAGFIKEMNEACGQGIDLQVGERCTAAPGEFRSKPGSNRMNEGFGACRRQIVKGDKALPEPVPAAAPTKDQRHGGGGNGAIIVADQALKGASLPPSAARASRSGNPFLVGAAKEQGHESRLIEQARGGQ